MGERLTEADFARSCAYLASTCAQWAGGALVLPECYQKPASVATVARFTDEIRERLDYLDKLAGRSLLKAGETQ